MNIQYLQILFLRKPWFSISMLVYPRVTRGFRTLNGFHVVAPWEKLRVPRRRVPRRRRRLLRPETRIAHAPAPQKPGSRFSNWATVRFSLKHILYVCVHIIVVCMYGMICYAMSCYIVFCSVLLCCVMFCSVVLCYVMYFQVLYVTLRYGTALCRTVRYSTARYVGRQVCMYK